MLSDALDSLLLKTLADQHLSGNERQALQAVLADQRLDDAQKAQLSARAFDLARGEMLGPESHRVLEWLQGVVKLLVQPSAPPPQSLAEAWFSPEDDCPQRIGGLFRQARRSVDVCVFTITDDRITDAILSAQARGMALRLLTDADKATDHGSDIFRLQQTGIAVRMGKAEEHMHHKFALFDGEVLLTGSYNWTRGAANRNRENFIVSDDRRLVSVFARMFDRLWHESRN